MSATVLAVNPGIAWSVETPAPSGWTVGSVRFEPLEQGAGGLTVGGTGSYRGAVEVRRNGRSLAVVNDVDLEDYVRGIDEVPPSWPSAALQAQAIAARTYAAHKAGSTEATPWRAVGADICDTDRCQVYRGLDAERRAQGYGWLKAVEATAGRVLLTGNRPIMASYSASSEAPLAMSQNGARAMAMQGRSATDILRTYYGGIRPTHAPGRLPPTIRVALTTGTASIRLSATTPFRVVDGDGAVLAVSGVGDWKVVPSGQGVHVVPPATYWDSLSVALPPVEPDPAPSVRVPGRVVTAAAVPGHGPWAPTTLAIALVLATGAAAIASNRGRTA